MTIYSGDIFMANSRFLSHYGIQGQKWGIRRYQNPDGSLTEEGREHYGYSTKGRAKMYQEGLSSAHAYAKKLQSDKIKAETKYTKQKKRLDDFNINHPEDQRNLINKIRGYFKERSVMKTVDTMNSIKLAAKIGETEVNRILQNAISEGYKVNINNKAKYQEVGQDIVQTIITEGYQTVLNEDLNFKVKATRYSYAGY